MSAASSPNLESWTGLSADYTDALVRVASLRADGQHYVLFGWVELYPFDMAAPASWTAGKAPWSVPGRSGWSCAFSATKMTTAQALQWYGEAQAGRLNIAPQRAKPILAHAAVLAPEPALGRFSLAGAPFLVLWHDGPRIHRLVPLQKPPRAVYELRCIEAARKWLERHAGFDPFRFDEWLGGAALVAPNPLWSSLSLFRSDRTDAGAETLQLQIVPRRSAGRQADLTSLTAHIAEQRTEAWTSLVSLPVGSDGRASITLPQPKGLALASDVRTLIAKLGTQAPLVRVMPGQDKPVIHDRYLVIDDAVWHCGPSFNEIGERLGVLTRLPNPLEIRVMIGRVWRSSTTLLDLAPAPPSAGQS